MENAAQPDEEVNLFHRFEYSLESIKMMLKPCKSSMDISMRNPYTIAESVAESVDF